MIMSPMALKSLFFQFIMFALFYNSFVVQSVTFTIKNNCGFDIWPATLAGAGAPTLTGFQLSPQASQTLNLNPPWSGRVWARTICSGSPGNFVCQTADCTTGQIECGDRGGKPPATLVEFTLAGADQKDFFDVSLVDGFNLPVSVHPGGANCPATACAGDVNKACPNELAVKDGGGKVIRCNSACVAFNQPQYCCTGAYGSPQMCKPTSYSMIFKQVCPQAYSYAFDDASSTFTCPTGGDYVITFCP